LCCSDKASVGDQSIASWTSVGGTGDDKSEGKPNTGFVGVIIGFVERDKAERRSGSANDGGQNEGVSERDVKGAGVAERK